MYKLLLCCRYLRTRYIALASIISVMLGVATMIVVNSVMSGFTFEMRNRIHGILSDVIVESRGMDGFYDPERHMQQIASAAGDAIEGMTPTVVVPAMLNFEFRGQNIARQVNLIGIDERTQSQVSDFEEYLQHQANREAMSFQLREGGYDTLDHQAGTDSHPRPAMGDAGWKHRRRKAEWQRLRPRYEQYGQNVQSQTAELVKSQADDAAKPQVDEAVDSQVVELPIQPPPVLSAGGTHSAGETHSAGGTHSAGETHSAGRTHSAGEIKSAQTARTGADPFRARGQQERIMDPAKEQYEGLVLGIALGSYRDEMGADHFLLLPGDDVKVTVPTNGRPPTAVSCDFTIVDFYESKMSEYDSNFVFVPIRKLQELRGMFNERTGIGWVNSIQIKLKPGADGNAVRDRLRAAFPGELYNVVTWQDKQGPLLAAVHMEIAILNILLFLIIAVAGFGILAIFLMIVVEKTRDIGILKSLGASRAGILGIFLAYGLLLGLVGSGIGMVLGLLFVDNINEIADLISRATGQPIFDPSIYYFYKIPVIVDPWMIFWVVSGALLIAVLASVLPALRAAMLHPVEALRYE